MALKNATPERKAAAAAAQAALRARRREAGIKDKPRPTEEKARRVRKHKVWIAKNIEHVQAYRKERRIEKGDELRAKEKEWRDANPDKIKAKNDQYRVDFAEQIAAKQKEWYNKGGAAVKSETSRQWRARIRREVLDYYGGPCKVCGVSDLEMLVLDHINDDGAAHRRSLNKFGSHIYKWAIDKGFPPLFQVLCHNHNTKKERRRTNYVMPALRVQAFAQYGEVCQCCGEKDTDVLQLDHIAGGGRAHMRFEGFVSAATWARQNGWPPIFQTLCANCNFSKHIGKGTCLHKRLPAQP